MNTTLKILIQLSSIILVSISCSYDNSSPQDKDAVAISRAYLASRGFDKATLYDSEEDFLTFFSSKDTLFDDSFEGSSKKASASLYEKCYQDEICYQLIIKNNRLTFVSFLAQRSPNYDGGKSSVHVVVLVDTVYKHAIGMLKMRKKGSLFSPYIDSSDLILPSLSYDDYEKYQKNKKQNEKKRTQDLVDSLSAFFSVKNNKLVSKIDMIYLFYERMEYRNALENIIKEHLLTGKDGFLGRYELKDSVLTWHWTSMEKRSPSNFKVCITHFEAQLFIQEDL